MLKREDIDSAFLWLQKHCQQLVAAARFQTADGLVFYYPVADSSSYPSFYLRDFVYMYESAPEFFPDAEVRRVLKMLLSKLRSDGWAPERISMEGHAIYRCHGNGDVVDSGPFFVKLFNTYAEATGDFELVRTNLDKFWKMLEVLPHEKDTGLVWIDPQNPHTGYGFTDTIAKTGRELFCSLLVYEALTTVQKWASHFLRQDLCEHCDRWRSGIRNNLSLLWSERDGMFYAASKDCKQIDVWGSAYACRLGLPSPSQCEAIVHWLVTNRNNVEYRGHLRHVPEPQFWQRLIPPFGEQLRPGEFQNGPYWSTPSGWYAEILESRTSGAGLQLLCDLVQAFREIGIWECIGRDGYRRITNNLSSALLPYAAFKRFRVREED